MSQFYKIYHFIGQGRLRYYGCRIMEFFGLRHKVIRMDIRLTCNLKCPTCVYSKDNVTRYQQPQMSLQDFEKIADDLFPKTLVLALACQAEPLVVNNFDKYLDVVGKYKIPTVTVPTNGTLLTGKYIEALIRNKITEVCISMDGALKETYERFRAGAIFEKVTGNIEKLIKRKNELGSKLPNIRFNYVINKDNVSEICDFIKLAVSLSGETIMFRHFTNWGGKLSYHDYSLLNNRELYNKYYHKAIELSKTLDIEVSLPLPFKMSTLNSTTTTNNNVLDKDMPYLKKFGCVNPWFYVYIRPDGTYRPCTYMDFEGNIINQSYAKYQKSEIPSQRKWKLLNDLEHSCMHDTCKGAIMGRVNDDSNLFGE